MSNVKILPEPLINKIAAGEVVERPSSVVKELVENSIDAGADQIFITVVNGGKEAISILDNGMGMSPQNAQLAIERHATSKIFEAEDLEKISTMGFRGEALAAISAVSMFEITTCHDEDKGGFQIRLEGGKKTHSAKIGFPKGTRINVDNLFFNTPARQKFLKSFKTEYHHIYDFIVKLALGHPNIQFKLTHNNKVVLNIPKNQTFIERVQHCFGSEITDGLMECKYEESYLSFHGLISKPSRFKPSRRWQHTFVNNRYVKCQTINHGIYAGYKTLLMKNMHPMFFIKMDIDPKEIDVNVHPAKTEIRIKNPNLIHTIFSDQISRILKEGTRNHFFVPASPVEPTIDETIKRQIETTSTATSQEQPMGKQKEKEINFYEEPNEQLGFMAQVQKQDSAKPKVFLNPIDRPETEEPPPVLSSTDKEEAHLNPKIASSTSSFEALGQLHKKYILAQQKGKLLIIDQHAAHERIRFEEIKANFYNNSLDTCPLIIPLLFELPPQDGILLEQNMESWEKLGFIIEHFGGNDYSIKEVPLILKDRDIEQVIKSVLDEMSQFGKSGKIELFYNEVFSSIACHSAIRTGQTLSLQEMQTLLDQLASSDLQLSCPHGRPCIIEFPIEELDKKFKRIV